MGRLAVPFSLLALLALYVRHDRSDPRRPASAALSQGWWNFSDQGRILTDTLAWAAGDLAAAKHYYLAGYPLLGVPFVRLTPANPFLLPDAGCLLLSLWLTAGIAAELAPGWRAARALGALAFLLTAAIPATMEVWVTPWTTTPAAALTLGCLLALLRWLRQPWSWRLAGVAAACAGAILAVRPSDGALLCAITAGVGGAGLLAARPGWRAALAVTLAAGSGVLLPALASLALYLAEHGLHLSPYLTYSAALGFDLRLLPLQWVTLVLDPQPLLPGGEGLLPSYPFIATGLAGMAACVAAPPGGSWRGAHLAVAAAAMAHGALYLCYRDLHPQGLWAWYNYHYFKWLLPVLALYTAFLLTRLLQPAALAAAAAVLLAILPWRAQLDLSPLPAPAAAAGHRLDLPSLPIGTGLVAAASGPFDSVYSGFNNYYFGAQGERWYGAAGSIAAYPLPGGLLLTPLRRLVPGPGIAMLDPSVWLDPSFAPRLASLDLVYGRPCYLPAWLGTDPSCQSPGPIPPPVRAPGQAIPFDASAAPLLLPGWSDGGPGALWTEGGQAGFHLRVQPAPAGAALVIEATAYVPPGSPALDVAVLAGGAERGRFHLGDAAPHSLRVPLPPDAFGAGGLLEVGLRIGNPRQPWRWARSLDIRQLGLRVRSVTVEPAQ